MKQLLDSYKSLMVSLATLPHEIAAAQSDLSLARRQLAETKRTVDQMETAALAAAEGSNDTKRKADAQVRLSANAAYQRFVSALRSEQEAVDNLANEVDSLVRQLQAASAQARLHGDLLRYIGNAGQLVAGSLDGLGDVVMPRRDPMSYPTGNGKSSVAYVTTADAAAIGL